MEAKEPKGVIRGDFDRSGQYEAGLKSLVKSLQWAFVFLQVVIIDKLSVVAEETAVSDGKAASEALVVGDLAVEPSDGGDQLFERGRALFLEFVL